MEQAIAEIESGTGALSDPVRAGVCPNSFRGRRPIIAGIFDDCHMDDN
jgi:hypothetical protein